MSAAPDTDDRHQPPTVAERLATARNGADVLGAAGMASAEAARRDNVLLQMGFVLLRLRAEYDRARAAVAPGDGVMAVLTRLPSLPDALERLTDRVLVHADAAGVDMMPGRPAKIVARVLDVWLDPTCPPCGGTGVVRPRDRIAAARRCQVCNGTGARRDMRGGDGWDRPYALAVLADVDDAVQRAGGAVAQRLARFSAGTDAP